MIKVFNCICGFYTTDKKVAIEHVKNKTNNHQITEVR